MVNYTHYQKYHKYILFKQSMNKNYITTVLFVCDISVHIKKSSQLLENSLRFGITHKIFSMANKSTSSLLLVTLICISLAVAAARTKLYQTNNVQESIAVPFTGANDSICNSMVEPQGYVCQEHQVRSLTMIRA